MTSASRLRSRGAPFACLWFAACALTAPAAQTTLAADPAREIEGVDALAAAALQRADAEPDDGDAALAATALLFQAADLRLQTATVASLDAAPPADVAALLAADDRIADPARTAILSLCTEGLRAAERVLVARPGCVAALVHRGLHLSLVAWANGPARSLFAGYGSKLVAAIDAAVAADPAWDDAAPLRLLGRFRGQAPWPYGDLPAAKVALERAVAQAPLTVNHLFLGDVLWRLGERAAARAQWHLAAAAHDDASTHWSGDLLRELARRRLAAARE